MTLGIKLCEKCGCHEAFYSVEYDDPIDGKRYKHELCRPCMLMMRNTIRRCQGMFE